MNGGEADFMIFMLRRNENFVVITNSPLNLQVYLAETETGINNV